MAIITKPKPISVVSTSKPTTPILTQMQGVVQGNEKTSLAFSHWFNHPYSHIYRNKNDNHWSTAKFSLLPTAIFSKWKSPDLLIGLRFGKETNYGLIDIDADSKYHNESGLSDIKGALEDIGINRTQLIQSSYSKGWHLYFFLPEKVRTIDLAIALTVTLKENNLEIAQGQLEIFPNKKQWSPDKFSEYNGHRLPLQPRSGSYLLDADFSFYSDSIVEFLLQANECALNVDVELLREKLATASDRLKELNARNKVVNFRRSGNGSSEVYREWVTFLEQRIANGWTDFHQTNKLIKDFVTYGVVVKGITSPIALEEYVYNLAINCPGYGAYCRHQRDIRRVISDWIKSTVIKNEYYVPYCGYPDRLSGTGESTPKGKGTGLTNDEKMIDAMERIVNAVRQLEAAGTLETSISKRRTQIAKFAHCSEKTLAKQSYLSFWHPKHYTPYTAMDTEFRSHPLLSMGVFVSENFYNSEESSPPRLPMTDIHTQQGLQPFSANETEVGSAIANEANLITIEDELIASEDVLVTIEAALKIGDRVRCAKYPNETFVLIELTHNQARIENGWGFEWIFLTEIRRVCSEDDEAA